MSKQDQLIEYLVQDVVALLMENQNLSMEEAMHRVYSSRIFDLLQDTETGLYLNGASYLYQMYVDEDAK